MAYIDPEQPLYAITTGPLGAEVGVMQFPKDAECVSPARTQGRSAAPRRVTGNGLATHARSRLKLPVDRRQSVSGLPPNFALLPVFAPAAVVKASWLRTV